MIGTDGRKDSGYSGLLARHVTDDTNFIIIIIIFLGYISVECPDMALNYLIVSFMSWWVGEWEVTPLLSLFPGPLWPGEVVLVKFPSMDQIELFNLLILFKQMTNVQLKLFNWGQKKWALAFLKCCQPTFVFKSYIYIYIYIYIYV